MAQKVVNPHSANGCLHVRRCNVRSTPEIRHVQRTSRCPLSARSGHCPIWCSLGCLPFGVISMWQAADCNPSNEIGQLIDKRLVERQPKWILYKQVAVPHENAALTDQA